MYKFETEDDAIAVASQLYKVERFENIIFGIDLDRRALELAASLVGAEYHRITGTSDNIAYIDGFCCRLPFPIHERETYSNDKPVIYVRCLSAYSHGFLHGMWISCDRSPEEIMADINWMLSWSPVNNFEHCDEWAIHDYEGWGNLTINEYSSINSLAEIAQGISEYGEVYACYINWMGGVGYGGVESFEDKFRGIYKDEEAFVEELFKETIPSETLLSLGIFGLYIDLESIARDLFINDYFTVKVSNGIAVFSRQ